MTVSRTKTLACAVVLICVTDVALAQSTDMLAVLSSLSAGEVVHITVKPSADFNAIWITRDGDRAILLRIDTKDAVSVPVESLRQVRALGQAGGHGAAWGSVGALAGFFAGLVIVAALVH